jgi:hypothetical protein
MPLTVWIGFDPREAAAFAVARHSVRKRSGRVNIPVRGLVLSDLRDQGLYYRPTEVRDGRLWDVISGAPMSTEFAISRFLVPHLQRSEPFGSKGWALFMDCDMLVRGRDHTMVELKKLLDPSKAVMCVKHHHEPPEGEKMDGQAQLRYARKNWTSVIAFNLDHPANDALTVEMVNTLPGRDLHRLCWLQDEEIGELGLEWNWLAGHSDPSIDPKIVHHTEGSPCLPGYEDVPFADEWRKELADWAS